MPTISAKSRMEVAANPFSRNMEAALLRINSFLDAFLRGALAINQRYYTTCYSIIDVAFVLPVLKPALLFLLAAE